MAVPHRGSGSQPWVDAIPKSESGGQEEARVKSEQNTSFLAMLIFHDRRLKNIVAKLKLRAITNTRSCLSWHQSCLKRKKGKEINWHFYI